jgi:hypothetical protein
MESLLPFLQGTCTPYNMPVYPGAQRIVANVLVKDLSGVSLPERWPVTEAIHRICQPAVGVDLVCIKMLDRSSSSQMHVLQEVFVRGDVL